ncbi:MAG: hypothetical protein CMJ87_13375 [Planctomycetes bacterium]|jgi:hypothetical protein|nr:hypothetical protein [Planctomycetota bacterium]
MSRAPGFSWLPLALLAMATGCPGGEPSTPAESATPAATLATVTPAEEGFTDSDGRRYDRKVLNAPDGELELADLDGLSPAELRVWRNAIYARHGYPFKSADLTEIFEKQPWYERKPSFDAKSLTATDKANVALIKDAEKAAREDVPAGFPAFFREFESAVGGGTEVFVLAHVQLPLTRRLRVMTSPSTLGEAQVNTYSREDLLASREFWPGMDAEVFERPDEADIEHHPGWQLVLGEKMYTGAGAGAGTFTFEGRGRQVAASRGSWKPGVEWGDNDNESTLLFAEHDGSWVLEEIYLVRFFP